MKIFHLLFSAAAILVAALTAAAQTLTPGSCRSQDFMQQLQQQDPAVAAAYTAREQQIRQLISRNQQSKQSGVVLKIPVVIHVVTESG
ncbi:MAG TPA: hypothetical protein VK927_06730, partial [Adhaeribacter sp.]|nr:hypothetical protein [Adhaeribacter sp.]